VSRETHFFWLGVKKINHLFATRGQRLLECHPAIFLWLRCLPYFQRRPLIGFIKACHCDLVLLKWEQPWMKKEIFFSHLHHMAQGHPLGTTWPPDRQAVVFFSNTAMHFHLNFEHKLCFIWTTYCMSEKLFFPRLSKPFFMNDQLK